MRTRLSRGLFRGAAAAALALAIGVGGTAKPAHAVDPNNAWVNVAVQVAKTLFGGGGDGGGVTQADLERAKQEIIAAVEAAKQEILNHIDAIAAADVRACSESATTTVAQIDRMDEFTLPVFVLGAVDCAYLASSYFDTVQDIRAADHIGMLIGEIYSIAMVGFAKLGFPVVDLLDDLIASYERVVTRLTPTDCVIRRHPHEQGVPPERWWECTAYNGDKGQSGACFGVGCQPNRAAAEDNATRNTSRAAARKALPELKHLRATL